MDNERDAIDRVTEATGTTPVLPLVISPPMLYRRGYAIEAYAKSGEMAFFYPFSLHKKQRAPAETTFVHHGTGRRLNMRFESFDPDRSLLVYREI